MDYRFGTLLLSIACQSLSASAIAQTAADAFPTKAVTIVMPVGAGGPNDREARFYVNKLGELLGQPFVMDFKPGAAGTIGAAQAAKAPGDGYTLLFISSGFTIFPAFYKNLPFDTLKDFAPLSMMSQRTSVLLMHPSFPARNFSEYIAYARANPGKVNFGTTGSGGLTHLAGAWMHSATDTKVTFIHYKGSAPELLDLATGRIDVAPTALASGMPLIKSGKARVLAILNDRRSLQLPGAQTIAEQGVPEYNYANWLAYVAPASTPAAIAAKLSAALARVAKSPDVAGPLEADGSIMVGSTPDYLRQVMMSETNRWRKLVQDNDIKAEE